MAGRQEMTGTEASHDSPLPALDVRDPTYYFDDGNVVLVVGETLFKASLRVLPSYSELQYTCECRFTLRSWGVSPSCSGA